MSKFESFLIHAVSFGLLLCFVLVIIVTVTQRNTSRYSDGNVGFHPSGTIRRFQATNETTRHRSVIPSFPNTTTNDWRFREESLAKEVGVESARSGINTNSHDANHNKVRVPSALEPVEEQRINKLR